MKNALKLIFSILLCEAAGVIGSVFTVSAIPGWYASLIKPSFTPPNWLFGPVWITLYALMGIALFLVWQEKADQKAKRLAVGLFLAQLAANAAWSIVFFGLHRIFAALLVIITLWLLIAAVIILFKRISKPASWLLGPYLLWVSFASLLNLAFWRLN